MLIQLRKYVLISDILQHCRKIEETKLPYFLEVSCIYYSNIACPICVNFFYFSFCLYVNTLYVRTYVRFSRTKPTFCSSIFCYNFFSFISIFPLSFCFHKKRLFKTFICFIPVALTFSFSQKY